mmetsp:Transcript_25622/g.59314  ORF Transcript_25622/g.59314 Transcript_25622/m.59314 type:complete len:215 (-) Transcript_25622:60-704(-)
MSTKGTSSTVVRSATSTSASTAGWTLAIFPSAVGASTFSADSDSRKSSASLLISRSTSPADVMARLRVARLLRTWSSRKAQACANLPQHEVTSTCRWSRSARTLAVSTWSARTRATSNITSSSRGRCCRLQRPRCPLSLVQYPSRQHGFSARGSDGSRPWTAGSTATGGASGAGCRCAKSLLSARWLVLPPSLAMCETTTPVIYRWLPESESFS